MSDQWNAKKKSYADCPNCEGVGRWWVGGQHCETCYERRFAELETRIFNQMTEIGHLKALVDLFEDHKQQLHEMKQQAERQRDELAAALSPFAAIGELFRSRPSLGGYGVNLAEANRDDWIHAADALARLEGENEQARGIGHGSED